MEDKRHNDDVIIAKLESLEKFLMLKISNSEEELRLLREQVGKNGERIRIIELWQSNSMGRIAVIVAIVGTILIAFINWVFKHF